MKERGKVGEGEGEREGRGRVKERGGGRVKERGGGGSLVPSPSRALARKRVWNLSQDFLALLSQHVRKTGKPIRTQDSKQSCDFNAYWNTARFQFQLPSVYARIGIGPYAQST